MTNFAFTSTFKIANETNLSHNLVPGECNRCYKPFKDEELLVEHIKSHDGDSKPFECYICRTGFQHKRSLKCHLIKVSNLIAADFVLLKALLAHWTFSCNLKRRKYILCHSTSFRIQESELLTNFLDCNCRM